MAGAGSPAAGRPAARSPRTGIAGARRLRQAEWAADTVLVALTGWGQDEDKRRSEAAGFNHHLIKPVDPAALESLLGATAE